MCTFSFWSQSLPKVVSHHRSMPSITLNPCHTLANPEDILGTKITVDDQRATCLIKFMCILCDSSVKQTYNQQL